MPRSPDIAGSQPFASEPALRAPQGGHCPPVLSYRQPQVRGGTRHTTGRKVRREQQGMRRAVPALISR
jgi:hypothetical protein